ncbi:MAG: type III pantothenate kinase [Planctomycetota bacterium]
MFGIDIGNSGLRIAELHVARQTIGPRTRINWSPPGAPAQSETAAVRYEPADEAWLDELSEFTQVEGATWLVSSVRRDAMQVLQESLTSNSQEPKVNLIQVHHSHLQLDINVDAPERVGIDRLLAGLAGAHFLREQPGFEQYAGAAIVIQAGSAVTVDEVSMPSEPVDSSSAAQKFSFRGGAILPGIPLMLRMLGAGTDQLPNMNADNLTSLPELPGKNTEEAMLCGAASALLGGVSHVVERYRLSHRRIHSQNENSPVGQDSAPNGEWNVPVILSGGDGMRISPHLSSPVFVHSDLVLQGLTVLAGQMRFEI